MEHTVSGLPWVLVLNRPVHVSYSELPAVRSYLPLHICEHRPCEWLYYPFYIHRRTGDSGLHHNDLYVKVGDLFSGCRAYAGKIPPD